MNELDHNKLITQIESLLDKARNQVAVQVNNTLLVTYMEIGRLIVEDRMTKTIKKLLSPLFPKILQTSLEKDFLVQIFGI